MLYAILHLGSRILKKVRPTMCFSLAKLETRGRCCWGLREGKFRVVFRQSFLTAHTLRWSMLLNILIIIESLLPGGAQIKYNLP